MKNIIRPTLTVLSFATILSIGATSYATAPYCQDVIFNLDFKPNLLKVKSDFRSELKVQEIPSRISKNNKNEIPVVLLNHQSSQKLTPYLDKSIGTQVVYQPDWNNDHGLVRINHAIADMDTPGARRFGELHATGIQWKNLYDYVELRSQPGRGRQVIVEVSYALSRRENEIAQIYHTMRRSAIVRVPFTFGRGQNNLDHPNMLKNSGEHCFIFCNGSGVSGQIREIAENYKKLNLGDIEVTLSDAQTQKFLDDVEARLLNAFTKNKNKIADKNIPEPQNAQELLKMIQDAFYGISPLKYDSDMNPQTAKQVEGYQEISQRLFKDLTPEQQMEAMNWLIGYRVSKNYQNLLQTLGVSGGTGYSDMNNPRATAVFIYDNGVTAQEFNSTEYTANGKFSTWSNRGTEEL